MADPDALLWYDGAMRSPGDAAERIERDGLAFLEKAAADFESDDSAWLLLIEGLRVPDDLDDLDEGTFYRHPLVTWRTDHLAVHLSERLPRRLAATFDALSAQPWCVSPQLGRGTIEMQVRGLTEDVRGGLVKRIRAREQDVCEQMRRGVSKLSALIAPSGVPGLVERLPKALAQVEAITSAKQERVRLS